MIAAFAILLLAILFLLAGFSGRSLAEVVRGEIADPTRNPFKVDIPAATATATVANVTGGTGGTGLDEVFYDPLGQYLDGGTIHEGSIGGHSDHVHVGGDHAKLLQLARVAQTQFKLTIREFEPYDHVDPVHVPGSLHYSGRAFDASGSPANMMAFARYLIGRGA